MAKLSVEARMSIKVLTDKGVSNREVARLLGVSEGCVRYHRRRQAAGTVDGRSHQVRRQPPFSPPLTLGWPRVERRRRPTWPSFMPG